VLETALWRVDEEGDPEESEAGPLIWREPEWRRDMTMRRVLAISGAVLMLALLASCGKKADQAAGTSSDSLLAANPVETPEANITPQSQYNEPAKTQEPPPAAKPSAKPKSRTAPPSTPAPAPVNPGVSVPAGTGIKIAVNAQVSSETAQPGDAWAGTVTAPVVIGTAAPIPAGSKVSGVVVAAEPAEKGSRAFLVLAVRSIEIAGTTHPIRATADSVIAGSTRARNLGAIAGSAAAGALIGKAVGGSKKGAVIGGLIGAAAGTGAVAASKGYQVTIKEGTEIVFNVNDTVVLR
jgi:hypothetical protein